MDRGESLGINKTVMNAVSELRRNLPELAASLVRTPSASAPYAAYPLLDEQMTDDRHVSENESRMETERAATELRAQNKRLGESITWILSVLQSKESSEAKDEDAARVSVQKKEALESLAYVRNILGGEVKEIDERRLWGAEEYNKRLEGQSKQESREASVSQPRQRSMTNPTNEHPTPLSQREVRNFTSGTPVSLRPTTFAPLHSPSIASRAIPMALSTHNRSQSSTGAFPVKPITMQRTPLRLSSNNPFQRTPDAAGIPPAAVKSDQSPKVRSEVRQHDPLGVLK
jgi:TBC1 domain family protein 5